MRKLSTQKTTLASRIFDFDLQFQQMEHFRARPGCNKRRHHNCPTLNQGVRVNPVDNFSTKDLLDTGKLLLGLALVAVV